MVQWPFKCILSRMLMWKFFIRFPGMEFFLNKLGDKIWQKNYLVNFLKIPFYGGNVLKSNCWYTQTSSQQQYDRPILLIPLVADPKPLLWMHWHAQFDEPCTQREVIWHLSRCMSENFIRTGSWNSVILNMRVQVPLQKWFMYLLTLPHNSHLSTELEMI